jgi:RNA polymerase sigma factor (sigma-70 family)
METTAADLFERHHVAIFRFFRRVTGSPDLAEDLTQDVFVRVVKAVAEYQPRGREPGWLFQIARTILIDHHRRRPEPSAKGFPSKLSSAMIAPTPCIRLVTTERGGVTLIA